MTLLHTTIIIFFTLLSFLLFPAQSVFASSWEIDLNSAPEKMETIQEMQENIESLESEKTRLDFKWNTFLIWNETLWDLMRIDLSDADKQYIENLVISYKDSQDKYEWKITRAIELWKPTHEITRDFFHEKKDFYMGLVQFIQIEKLESYAKYINSDLIYNEKSQEVGNQIEQKTLQREERIEEIQSQIDSNTALLRERIKQKVTQRVTQRLDAFVQQEKFQSLSNGWKVIMFEKLILKVEQKLQLLEESEISSANLEESYFLYGVIREILEEYILNWK